MSIVISINTEVGQKDYSCENSVAINKYAHEYKEENPDVQNISLLETDLLDYARMESHGVTLLKCRAVFILDFSEDLEVRKHKGYHLLFYDTLEKKNQFYRDLEAYKNNERREARERGPRISL